MYIPGPSKEYIRDSVFLHFMDCKYILTLPNLYFGLETMFILDGKKVDCTEYKVNTFKGQQKIAPKGVTLYNRNVKDIDISNYDGIFLDFYGTFNKSYKELFPRIQSGTKLAITFMMARENKELQKVIDITNREESYVKLLSSYGINIKKYAKYCDTTPMCVFFGTKQ